MSLAAVKKGEDDRHVVAVIGDGSMSGGLAFEGLNNVSDTPNNMLIILNDNHMSIDRAVGGMKEYLLHLHTSSWYNRLRLGISRKLTRWGVLNENRRRAVRFLCLLVLFTLLRPHLLPFREHDDPTTANSRCFCCRISDAPNRRLAIWPHSR